METKLLVYIVTLLLSCTGLYFSIRYTVRRLRSGKITSYARQGRRRGMRQTHTREHHAISYWFFLIIYSTLLNGPVAALFFLSAQGLYIQSQL